MLCILNEYRYATDEIFLRSYIYTEGKSLAISYNRFPIGDLCSIISFYKQLRKHVSCLKMI